MLLPPPEDAVHKGLESVVDAACANGAPEPPWVAVDDGSDRWIALVAARSRAERRLGVAAVSSDRALVTAHRLGVGGAFMLPPSTLAAFEALTAATTRNLPPVQAWPEDVGILEGQNPMHVVTAADNTFWCCQLGEPVLTRLLVELATLLEIPPVILPWPALIVEGEGIDRVEETWNDLRAKTGGPVPDLAVARARMDGGMVLAAAYAALLTEGDQTPLSARIEPVPVNELPTGGQVGWWAIFENQAASTGWKATPSEVTATRCRWRVEGHDLTGTVKDVVTTDELNAVQEDIAVRVPGWLIDHLIPGSPAGLLVSNLAEAAARRGIPLWIPNVDAEALQIVLRLPGVLWVDGPAVPRST